MSGDGWRKRIYPSSLLLPSQVEDLEEKKGGTSIVIELEPKPALAAADSYIPLLEACSELFRAAAIMEWTPFCGCWTLVATQQRSSSTCVHIRLKSILDLPLTDAELQLLKVHKKEGEDVFYISCENKPLSDTCVPQRHMLNANSVEFFRSPVSTARVCSGALACCLRSVCPILDLLKSERGDADLLCSKMVLDWPIWISVNPDKIEKYAVAVEGWPKKLRKQQLLEHGKSITLCLSAGGFCPSILQVEQTCVAIRCFSVEPAASLRSLPQRFKLAWFAKGDEEDMHVSSHWLRCPEKKPGSVVS
ncbi:hypothetical protein Q9966_000664 [Columba livia]|nr:hypothetical protein Q9966_000664 [Columba livia]